MASDNIQVLIRLRPLIKRELTDGAKVFWRTHDNQILQKDGNYNYHFDKVYSQEDSTYDVYAHLQPLIAAVMGGFNGTVFAYGQTASGKTFTMTGNQMYPGVIPLTVEEIFSTIEESPDREFLIRVSYMEIYNENVVDLLGDVRKHLEVRENTDSTIFVENLSEQIVTSSEQIYELMQSGESNRHYGSTSMNERSSRSHTIFRLIIESKDRIENPQTSMDDGAIKVSTMNLVDLAGSEKAKQTGATGQRLAEGGFINRSLLSLTSVISQLSENAGFISYRDSKLTRILQNSLGGNSKTAIICNCTPAALDETLSTLRFANRAKRIKNKPKVNEVLSDEALLKKYKRQINNLQKTLNTMKKTDIGNVQEEKMELQLRLEKEKEVRQDQEDKIYRLTELICVSNKIKSTGQTPKVMDKRKRRETWCPGKARKSMAPWAQGSMLHPIGTPKGFASASRPLTYFKAPTSPVEINRRARSDEDKNNSFIRDVFGNQTISEESEEALDDSCDDLVKKQVDFDLSYMPSRSPFVCDVDCQTEAMETNATTEEFNFKLEFISCELETKNQRIQELETDLANKETELVTLNTTMEQAFEKSLKEEESLRSEIWELTKKLEVVESGQSASQNSVCQKELELKIEGLQEEKSGLEKELSELCNSMQQLIGDLDRATKATIEAEKKAETTENELKEINYDFARLKMNYNALEQDFETKEQDLRDLEEFTQLETDYKNMSILEKSEAKRRLSSLHSLPSPFIASSGNTEGEAEKLRKEISDLKKDTSDAEFLFLETKKELATSRDETKLLDQELREMKKTLQKYENEKQDFDILIEMEVKKSKRRENELLEQLKRSYAELGHEPPVENGKVEATDDELNMLKDKLDCLVKELATSNAEKETMMNEKEQAVNDKTTLLKEKDTFIQEKSILTLEKDTLEQENNVLMKEKNTLSQELNMLTEEKEVLEDEKKLVLEERDELKQDRDIFVHENDVLTQEKDSIEKEKEELSQKVLILQEKFEQLNQQISTLVEDKEILSKQRNSLLEEQQNLHESFKAAVDNAEVPGLDDPKLTALIQEKEVLASENKTFSDENNSLAQEINKLTEQIEALTTEKGELNEERVSLVQANEALKETITEMKKQMFKDTTSDEPKSLFDELDELTVGLTGMFPQKSMMMDQSSCAATPGGGGHSELEQSAFRELQQDLEYQISQLKKELSCLKECEVKMTTENDVLLEEKGGLQLQVDNLQCELCTLRDELKNVAEDKSDSYNQDSNKAEKEPEKGSPIKENNDPNEQPTTEKDLNLSNSLLEAEKQSSMDTIRSLEAEIASVKTENLKLEELIAELKEEKAKSEIGSNETVMLQQENTSLQKVVEDIKAEKEELLKEISEVKLQSADEVEKSLETIKELKEQISELNENISQLQVQIQELEEGKQLIISEHVDETNDFINQLEKAKEENSTLLEKHSSEVNDLEKQISEVNEEVCTLKTQSEAKREELESLVCSLEDEISEKSDVIKEGKSFLCKYQTEVEALKVKLSESEIITEENVSKISAMETENSALKLNNETLQDEVDHMKASLSDTYSVSDQIEKLQGQITELREEREAILSSKRLVEEELEKLKAEFTEMDLALTEASENLAEHKEKVETLETTINRGHEMLQQYDQDIKELQEECEKASEEKEDLEQKYEALLDKYDSHLEELKSEHESESQSYVDKIEELQKNYDTTCAEYEEQLKGLVDSKNEELEQQYNTQIERLKQELEDMKAIHNKVEAKLTAELVEKEQALEGELNTLRETLQNTEIEFCNKALQLESKLDEQTKESEHQINKLQSEKEMLQDQVDEFKNVVDEYNKESEKDAKSLKQKEAKISELTSTLAKDKLLFEEEEQRLMKCCDDADVELSEVTTKYNQLETEFEDYKKKMLTNTTQSFENAEGNYQKKLDLLKQHYEQEILRLKNKKEEVHNDLDQSVCQLNDGKTKQAELQAALRTLQTDNEKLRSSLQTSNGRIQQLQKDLNFQVEFTKEETDHLRSCVDSAEYDLDRKNSECVYLKQDVDNLKKQLTAGGNSEKLKKLEEEKEAVSRQLAEQKMKIVMMSTQLMKAEDPYKKEIKYLKDENGHAKEQIQRLRNEVRRLKNNQPDDSVVFESSKSGTNRVAGSGVVNEVLRFTLEAEKHKLERDLKLAQEEVQRLKKHYDGHRLIITDLKTQLTERDDKIFRYKKYYRKQLNSEERETLKDVINSPKPPEKFQSKLLSQSTTSFSSENRPPVSSHSASASAGGEVNFLNMSTWLTKDPKKEEGPGECNTQ